MISSFQTLLLSRERCSHNLRFRLPDTSSICLICHCAKIEDMLLTECSGNRKLSSECLREIIHQFRIINSVLDVPIESTHVEVLLSPVLRIALALLKIQNEEIWLVVSEALDRIRSIASMDMLDNFLEHLSDQVLEKISIGNLEALRALIRRKECLSNFSKHHGPIILPQLFKTLDEHVAKLTTKVSDLTLVNTQTSTTREEGKRVIDKWPAYEKESTKIVEKVLDVLEANCVNDAILLVTSPRGSNELNSDSNVFPIYNSYLKGILSTCMKFLGWTERSDMPGLSTTVLNFLSKLHQYNETLQCLLSDSNGVTFCTTIKRLLYSHTDQVKIAALSMIHRMVVTYNLIMRDCSADKTFVSDLPSLMLKVDMVHFITETMTTASEDQFRSAVQVLNQINSSSMFGQERMIPVLEAALRVSTLLIPAQIMDMKTYEAINSLVLGILKNLDSVSLRVQSQLTYLFERLPTKWTTSEYLPWIKLLLFCNDSELWDNLWHIFMGFVHRSRNVDGNRYSVVPLKCVLLIAFALLKCNSSPSVESSETILQQNFTTEKRIENLMVCIMDECFLPPIKALVHYGKLEDCPYISIILQLLQFYPQECIKPFSPVLKHQSQVVSVTLDADTAEVANSINVAESYEICISDLSFGEFNGQRYWSIKQYLQLLGSVRLNAEFLPDSEVFTFWNKNASRIIFMTYQQYLPHFENSLQEFNLTPSDPSCTKQESTNQFSAEQLRIQYILEKLEIYVQNWQKDLSETTFNLGVADERNKKEKHDVILTFVCVYALLTGDNFQPLVDFEFIKRYSNFLNQYLKSPPSGKVGKKIYWQNQSFYSRIALILASVLPRDMGLPLAEKIEELLSLEGATKRFKEDVMVYNSSVFAILMHWNIFPGLVSLVELWLKKDKPSCVAFYTDGSFDELNEEINNGLITLAATGSAKTSTLAVEMGRNRLKKQKLSFSLKLVTSTVHNLHNKVLSTTGGKRDKLALTQLSNVMQLLIEDEYLFEYGDPLAIPTDLVYNTVQTMLEFHGKSMIGKTSLELLSKILRSSSTFTNVNQYLISHRDFIRILGNKLSITTHRVGIEESVFAHKLLALLLKYNQEKFISQPCVEDPVITWRLSSVISYIHDLPKVEILEFLVAIFKVDFKCPLIQVEELTQSPTDLMKALLNLLFHLQALTHKVTIREIKETMWELMFEYLRLAERRIDGVTYSAFKLDVIFQPWIKMAVTNLLAMHSTPAKAPVMSLEFLQKWTKMMLLETLENSGKRSVIQHTFVSQMYLGVFKTIRDAMKSDPSQATSGRPKSSHSANENFQLFDIERSSGMITQIAKNCDIFIAHVGT